MTLNGRIITNYKEGRNDFLERLEKIEDQQRSFYGVQFRTMYILNGLDSDFINNDNK